MEVAVLPKSTQGFDVRRLLDTEPCLCRSSKPYGECCLKPYPEGWSADNTVHLLFTVPSNIVGGTPSQRVQTCKLDGSVPAEAVVENIRKRLHSKPVQLTISRLPSFVPLAADSVCG